MKTYDLHEVQRNNSIRIANAAQELFGVETMLQLDCARLSEFKAFEILQQAKSLGLRNIIAMKQGSTFSINELILFQLFCCCKNYE